MHADDAHAPFYRCMFSTIEKGLVCFDELSSLIVYHSRKFSMGKGRKYLPIDTASLLSCSRRSLAAYRISLQSLLHDAQRIQATPWTYTLVYFASVCTLP